MTSRTPHPHLLAWHATGDLDPVRAGVVASHLQGCPACRKMLVSLRAVISEGPRPAGGEHPTEEDMVLHEAGDLVGPPCAAVDDHLEKCADCAEDLRILVRASAALRLESDGSSGHPDRHQRRRIPRASWSVAAAALVAALVGAPFLVLERPERGVVDRRATIRPVQRGAGPENLLEGEGPWSLSVILPFAAIEGIYEARIVAADGPGLSGPTWTVEVVDGATNVPAARLKPGRYRLVLEHSGGRSSYEYEFRVKRMPEGAARP